MKGEGEGERERRKAGSKLAKKLENSRNEGRARKEESFGAHQRGYEEAGAGDRKWAHYPLWGDGPRIRSDAVLRSISYHRIKLSVLPAVLFAERSFSFDLPSCKFHRTLLSSGYGVGPVNRRHVFTSL